jgi:hypothetical protein
VAAVAATVAGTVTGAVVDVVVLDTAEGVSSEEVSSPLAQA